MIFCRIEKGQLNPDRESPLEEILQVDNDRPPHFHRRTAYFSNLEEAQADALEDGSWEKIAENVYEARTDTHYVELHIIREFEHFPISEVSRVKSTDPDILNGTHHVCYGGVPEEDGGTGRFAYKEMKPQAFQKAFRESNQMQQLRADLAKAPSTALTAVEGIDIDE